MSEPRVITETVTHEWQVVGGPTKCHCGHEHYARVRDNFAPFWGFCEADCGCITLRPLRDAPPEPSTAPLTASQPPDDHGDGSGAAGNPS